jgi:hypothetical protein
MFEIHLDEQIHLLKEQVKQLEKEKWDLNDSIMKFIYYNGTQTGLENKLKAALHYGLEIKPTVLDGSFKYKMEERVAIYEIPKSDIGYPTYVGHIRDMIEHPVIWKDMWKDYVNRDKTVFSYGDFVKDIKQHKDPALLALIDQYYGERLILVNNTKLKLENIIIIVPKSAKIYQRFE